MRFSTVAAAAAAAGSASAQGNATICDKYTTALLMDNTPANQFTLVALLVKTAVIGNFTGPGSANPTLPGSNVTVPGILANGTVNGETVSLLPYFNGGLQSTNRNGMPTAVNFLDGGNSSDLVSQPMSVGTPGSNQATLFTHLVSYFGVLLGCSGYGEDGYAAYAGSNNQYNVHKYMDLSAAEFTYFIQQVGLSAQSFGASMEDINMAAMALNSTFGARCAPAASVVPDTDPEYQVMCIGDGCPLATNAVQGCSGEAAVPNQTPTSPAVAAATTASMSGSMTGTMTGSMTSGGAVMSATGAAESAASSGAIMAGANAAPRQTVAAGLMAGVAAVGALML